MESSPARPPPRRGSNGEPPGPPVFAAPGPGTVASEPEVLEPLPPRGGRGRGWCLPTLRAREVLCKLLLAHADHPPAEPVPAAAELARLDQAVGQRGRDLQPFRHLADGHGPLLPARTEDAQPPGRLMTRSRIG